MVSQLSSVHTFMWSPTTFILVDSSLFYQNNNVEAILYSFCNQPLIVLEAPASPSFFKAIFCLGMLFCSPEPPFHEVQASFWRQGKPCGKPWRMRHYTYTPYICGERRCSDVPDIQHQLDLSHPVTLFETLQEQPAKGTAPLRLTKPVVGCIPGIQECFTIHISM